ncbi:hypothetical protein Tco_0745045 [Tanacetum coccineum]
MEMASDLANGCGIMASEMAMPCGIGKPNITTPFALRVLQSTVVHLGSTWRKYTYFGLNLRRNGTRLQLYSKTLKNSFLDHGEGVQISCDAVRAFKGRRQDLSR